MHTEWLLLLLFFIYSIPRELKKYAMQYKKVQKTSWNEPYSSSSSLLLLLLLLLLLFFLSPPAQSRRQKN